MHMPNNVDQLTDCSQVQSARSALDEILRQGAQKLLGAAIQNEVDEYIQTHAAVRDEKGHRLVVRNGYLPERQIQTPLGEVSIRQARVNDRRPEQKFLSKLLPPYLRRTPSLEALIPALYLRGISTNDFSEALASLLGPNAEGLSPTNILRLKEDWARSSSNGPNASCPAGVMSIGGSMASTSTCVWMIPPAPVYWSSW